MTPRPLRIRYGNRPLREPAAWFIPGADPRDWLDEVARWGVPLAGLRLRVVPHSPSDLRPRGVLVTAPGTPRVSLRCLPYGLIPGGGRATLALHSPGKRDTPVPLGGGGRDRGVP